MDNLANYVEKKIVSKVSKVTNLKYLEALRSGFIAVIPLTLIGSIFMLIGNFPINGYSNFMAHIFGNNWLTYIDPATKATFNMMGILFAGTMAYKLANLYKIEDPLSAFILSVVSFVTVNPQSVDFHGKTIPAVLQFDWLGTKGIITAIIVAIISVEIIRFCKIKNLIFKLPDSVPPMVANAFSALIPGFLIVVVMLLINGISKIFAQSLPDLIYSLVQLPLQGLTGTAGAIILVAGLNGLFWWFGIHPTVINSVLYPLLYANAATNQKLYDAGNLTVKTGKIGSVQMLDQFATIGGAGCTIALIIAMILVSKSERLKTMWHLAGIPAFFNINEPLVFGLPIVFNPLLLIPVVLAPVASTTIAYISLKIGFMPMFTNVQAPWATPFIFSGFLVAHWQGAVTQIISVVVSLIIYLPFVKLLDKQYLKEELVNSEV
ncbi:PTS sugar transporter subunit IIC [Bombilactobacillus bombi]|uniref:Permease IIC component n=1 Tax=Bombilactobacillus bombi TaxID=1303590 RepID=A0A3R6V838_9LACO|nr:PTS transporter subunit EIIC [Bombilactobacillus bombi]RHW48825.1 PTS sugar transporter subunit IIC [Bombilactobacillus bombi]